MTQSINSSQPNLDRIRSALRPIHRIGLLSPTSGNLGNAAMQWAVIANVRKRIPDVEFLGITLDPADTRRRHGIDAFPLAGAPREYYAVQTPGGPNKPDQRSATSARIKSWLKRIPLLRGFWRGIRTCAQELAHIVAAARVVRRLDLIVIPGGSAVNDFWGGPWGHPWILFKWSALCRVYGVPFRFVSVGKSSLEKPLSRFFIRRALRFADYRSFRDEESKIAVEKLSGVRNDPIYPDLAFSYPLPVAAAHACVSADPRPVVGVNPVAYCDPRAWPRKDTQRYAAYVAQLAEMVKWLINERYRVLFFTTDSPDIKTVEDIQAALAGFSFGAGPIQTLGPSTEQSPESLLNGIAAAHLIIASRLHGVILSHLSAIPAVALSFDPKVDAHMNVIGQQQYCMKIDDLQRDTLIERFTTLRARREQESSRIRASLAALRQQLDEQYDEILGLKHASSVTNGYRNEIETLPLSDIREVRDR